MELHQIFLDKCAAKAIATGSVACLTASIGADEGPIVAAIGTFLSSIIGDNIKGGVWFDVNWILTGIYKYLVVTQRGWQ